MRFCFCASDVPLLYTLMQLVKFLFHKLFSVIVWLWTKNFQEKTFPCILATVFCIPLFPVFTQLTEMRFFLLWFCRRKTIRWVPLNADITIEITERKIQSNCSIFNKKLYGKILKYNVLSYPSQHVAEFNSFVHLPMFGIPKPIQVYKPKRSPPTYWANLFLYLELFIQAINRLKLRYLIKI